MLLFVGSIDEQDPEHGEFTDFQLVRHFHAYAYRSIRSWMKAQCQWFVSGALPSHYLAPRHAGYKHELGRCAWEMIEHRSFNLPAIWTGDFTEGADGIPLLADPLQPLWVHQDDLYRVESAISVIQRHIEGAGQVRDAHQSVPSSAQPWYERGVMRVCIWDNDETVQEREYKITDPEYAAWIRLRLEAPLSLTQCPVDILGPILPDHYREPYRVSWNWEDVRYRMDDNGEWATILAYNAKNVSLDTYAWYMNEDYPVLKRSEHIDTATATSRQLQLLQSSYGFNLNL